MMNRDRAHPADGPGSAESAQARGAKEQIKDTTNGNQTPPPKTALQFALERAAAGLPGFWIPKDDKRPRCKWKDIATIDPAGIRRQAEVHPGCNWGVRTGCVVGQYKLVVIDLDTKDGDGREEWREIVKQHGGFPKTCTVRTPSGGIHIYVWIPKEYPAPTSNKTFSQNIDISGENSLVVGEGSTTRADVDPGGRIKTGAYVAVNAGTPIAVAPDWFVKKIQRENREQSQAWRSAEYPAKSHSELVDEAREALDYIDPGINRDDWLKIIAALHDLGDAGYALALAWSSRWSRFDRKKFDSEWNSFNGRREVQLSTLFFYARQNPAYVEAMKAKRQKTGSYKHSSQSGGGAGAVPPGCAQGHGEQKEPVPLPPELAPVPAFDYDWLPPVLADFVKDVARLMSAPPDFIAFTLLVTAGSVIGRKLAIRPQKNTDWAVIVNMWMLAIGRAGFMKSPTMEYAMKPLERLAAGASRIYEEALAEYEVSAAYAKLEVEAKRKQVKDALLGRKGSSEATGPDDLVVDEPEPPIHRRYICNDPTEPALLDIMRDNPTGTLLYRDELVGLLKSLEKESAAGFREMLLQCYNGSGRYVSDRIERGKNLLVEALCLAMLGGTQPGKLARYIKAAVKGGAGDDGLLQRFMLIWPDPVPFKEVDELPSREKSKALHQLFRDLDELTAETAEALQDYDERGEKDGLPYLRFDDKAVVSFSEWRAELETRLRDGSLHPAMESHLAKFRKVIPALALILHLCDRGRGPVGEIPLTRALNIGEYLEAHANRTYGSIAMPKVSGAHQILAKIREGKLSNPFRARDVKRPGWTGLDNDTVPEALNLLVEHFWLDAVEPERPNGGHPTVDYYLNPLAEGRL